MKELVNPAMFEAHFLKGKKKTGFRWPCWIIFFCSLILMVALFTVIFDFRSAESDKRPPVGGLIGIGAAGAAVLVMAIMVVIQFRLDRKQAKYEEAGGRKFTQNVDFQNSIGPSKFDHAM